MERELKMALKGPADLDRILKTLPTPLDTIEQHNHYFVDPDGVLSRAGLMVRVREERSPQEMTPRQVVLTLKRRVSADHGVFLAQEEEELLPNGPWREVLGGSRDLLSLTASGFQRIREMGVSALRLRGTMLNVRKKVHLDGFVLEVDETTFPNGVVEAEIEVETEQPDEARALLEEVAREAGVNLALQTRGKYGRLLEHLARSET